MRHSILSVVVSSVLIAGCQAADKADKPVSIDLAPPAVQAAVKNAVGTHELESLGQENEDGVKVYEAKFEIDDVDHSVTISEKGDVLEEETEVKIADLPAAVSAAVLKAQPLGHAKEASIVKKGDQSYYEVDTKVGKEKHELAIATDGKLISDKVEAKEEKDGEKGEKDEKGEHGDKHDKKDKDGDKD